MNQQVGGIILVLFSEIDILQYLLRKSALTPQKNKVNNIYEPSEANTLATDYSFDADRGGPWEIISL